MSSTQNTNKTIMETPPSSPPQSKTQNSSDCLPPAVLSPDDKQGRNVTSADNDNNNNNDTKPPTGSPNRDDKKPGHTRTTTPSTPMSYPLTPSGGYVMSGQGQGGFQGGGGVAPQVQTPSRGGSYPLYPGNSSNNANTISGGYGGISGGGVYGHHGMMGGGMADLTPIISNSNVTYVDHHGPSYPTSASSSSEGGGSSLAGFVVVSPAMLRNGMDDDNNNENDTSLSYSPETSSNIVDGNAPSSGPTVGLRQRPSGRGGVGLLQRRLPPPRSTLPPAKRSSADAGMSQRIPSSSGQGPIGIAPVGECGPNSVTPTAPKLEESEGGLLLGEGLSMPSGLYSDESSIENVNEDGSVSRSGSGSGLSGNAAGVALPASIARRRSSRNPIVMEGQLQHELPPAGLAPIELKPDRKFFSFSGTSQYKRSIAVPIGGDEDDEEEELERGGNYLGASSSPFRSHLKTIHSPLRGLPPTSPKKEGQRQYQPSARGAHGVSQMADTKDLDAIFKASSRPGLNQVSPSTAATTPHASPFHYNNNNNNAMMVDGEEREIDVHEALRNPIAMDDRQWSIPSIRLANHVKTDLDSSYHSFQSRGTFSDDEYTDEGASLNDSCSYLADGDDASLSSKGSYEPAQRRRMITDVLRRTSSSGAPQIMIPNATFPPTEGASIQPHLHEQLQQQLSHDGLPTTGYNTFLLERNLGQITIDNNRSGADGANNVIHSANRADTFDDSELGDEMMADLSISIDDAAVDYYTEEQDGERPNTRTRCSSSSRRRHNRRHRGRNRRRGESESGTAAFEWLQDLQNQPTNRLLIAEAASSKFLTGASSGIAASKNGGVNAPAASSEDVSKSLGMPHPLCRSTTIDPQYVHRSGFGFNTRGSSRGDNNDMVNNSIALTSSGSS